jgi:hypothetical protein
MERGGRGRQITVLTSGEDNPGREIHRRQWAVVDAALEVVVGGSGEGGVTWEVFGGAESGAGLFIAVERRWSGRSRARGPHAVDSGNGGSVARFGQS